ncbi:hypothetical protein US8_01497 [Bacillus altitudinis]|nr:hypothetical protein US8_01497 [Bacillus altitudinis]
MTAAVFTSVVLVGASDSEKNFGLFKTENVKMLAERVGS